MIFRFEKEYAFLSNFYLVDIYNEHDGFVYPSVEHAYQAMKSDLPEWKDFCRHKDASAGMVKRKSKEIKLIDNWEESKVEFMAEFLWNKFAEHSDMKQKLMDTHPHNLVEGNYHNDTYWGVDLKQNPNMGENHLGRLLMYLRNEFIY